jgi:hypothetical protein
LSGLAPASCRVVLLCSLDTFPDAPAESHSFDFVSTTPGPALSAASQVRNRTYEARRIQSFIQPTETRHFSAWTSPDLTAAPGLQCHDALTTVQHLKQQHASSAARASEGKGPREEASWGDCGYPHQPAVQSSPQRPGLCSVRSSSSSNARPGPRPGSHPGSCRTRAHTSRPYAHSRQDRADKESACAGPGSCRQPTGHFQSRKHGVIESRKLRVSGFRKLGVFRLRVFYRRIFQLGVIEHRSL